MSHRSALDALLSSAVRAPKPIDVCPELTALSGAHDYDLGFDLSLPLLPYQRAGVAYALKQRRVILGDEMGLGKTPQLIAVALKAVEDGHRALIVVPPSLRLNWDREIAKFTSRRLTVEIAEGTTPYALRKSDVVIIGDASVVGWAPALNRLNFGALLVDEAHRFKNPKAKRTIALQGIARGIDADGYVVLASGTPATNRPVELVALLDTIGRLDPVFGSAGSFKWRYCDPIRNAFGWTFNGSTNSAELHDKLRGTCYIRRKKADVLTELPAKRRAQVAIALTDVELREYLRIESDFLMWVYGKGGREAVMRVSRAEAITQLTALRQEMAKVKVKHAIEHIESIVEGDQPVVIFGHHRAVLESIIAECETRSAEDPRWNVVSVLGGKSDAQKQQAVDDFQSGRASVFVGNYTSAGVGLTLTRANQWVSVELPWTPAELQQAEDRCHRFTQTESVTCWHLTGARANGQLTIDDRLFGLLNSKAEVLSAVLDGNAEDLGAEAGSLLASLLGDWVG
jgi:SWI/SNF-related matrix-associated actin-dependent regulator 1 of chromatin subfamily A